MKLETNPSATAFRSLNGNVRGYTTTGLPHVSLHHHSYHRRNASIACSASPIVTLEERKGEIPSRIGSLGQVSGVLGCQWGDEGKGKLVDILAKHFDVVARCQVLSSLQMLPKCIGLRCINSYSDYACKVYAVDFKFKSPGLTFSVTFLSEERFPSSDHKNSVSTFTLFNVAESLRVEQTPDTLSTTRKERNSRFILFPQGFSTRRRCV